RFYGGKHRNPVSTSFGALVSDHGHVALGQRHHGPPREGGAADEPADARFPNQHFRGPLADVLGYALFVGAFYCAHRQRVSHGQIHDAAPRIAVSTKMLKNDDLLLLFDSLGYQWFAAEDEGRTEDATEHKIRKAREEGKVAKSPDVTSALVLLF